jgi:hypothetical protein
MLRERLDRVAVNLTARKLNGNRLAVQAGRVDAFYDTVSSKFMRYDCADFG